MKYLRFNILCLILGVLAMTAAAQNASFSLVPPQNVVENQRFALTFRITNGQGSAPSAPELENCELLYGPAQSTMSSTQVVNGRATSSYMVDYTFTYLAKKAGKVEVPAVSVTVDGKRLSSTPASFQILPPSQSQSQQPQRPQRQGGGMVMPAPEVSQRDVFVRTFFSKSVVYEQEAVIATVKLYFKDGIEISSFSFLQQPAFEGFLSEELKRNDRVSLEHYNGENYNTVELNKYLLFPQKAGQLTARSGSYDVTAVTYEIVSMGFMRTRRPVEKSLRPESSSASITVKALPQPAPEGFNGAVGHYDVTTKLHPELLRTNEAATYEYIIRGTGNVKYLTEPKISFPLGFDSYTPKTEINATFNGSTYSGTYHVTYTIVPQEEGPADIESPEFVYFDLQSGSYRTVQPESFEVKVAKGNSTSTIVEQKAIEHTISDIRHIRPSDSNQSLEYDYVFGRAYYWMAYIVAALILVGVIIVYRRQLKLNADVKGRKLARANRVAAKRLKVAKKLMQQGQDDEFYAELSRALWGYVSDKLGIAPSQLTRDNISAKLMDAGASEADVQQVIGVLDECEMARFTPQHSREEISRIYDLASQAIGNLDNMTK